MLSLGRGIGFCSGMDLACPRDRGESSSLTWRVLSVFTSQNPTPWGKKRAVNTGPVYPVDSCWSSDLVWALDISQRANTHSAVTTKHVSFTQTFIVSRLISNAWPGGGVWLALFEGFETRVEVRASLHTVHKSLAQDLLVQQRRRID